MEINYIPNITSLAVTRTGLDKLDTKKPFFKSKIQYSQWAKEEKTQHFFVSGYTGEMAHIRISKDNPAVTMSCLVVDYDFSGLQLTNQQIQAACKIKPSYIADTFNGGKRLYFAFEKTILVQAADIHRQFIELLATHLKLANICPALDKKALLNNTQYYDVGYHIEHVSNHTVSEPILDSLSYRAGKQANWSAYGVVVPIEELRKKGAKIYPQLFGAEWQQFTIGMRTNRFWDNGDAQSVIVRDTGFQCFTGTKSFVPFAEVFGKDFVAEFETTKISHHTKNIYYDGRSYWLQIGERWYDHQKQDIELYLQDARSLSNSRKKGELSEVQRAIIYIQQQQRIDGLFPFIYNKKTVVSHNKCRYLNISRVRPTRPASQDKVQWGKGFTWIANYLEKVLQEQQLPYFLSWLAHAYRGAYCGDMQRGLSLIIAGGIGTGKTYLSTFLLPKLFGGHGVAENYLLGREKFNESLFESPLWTVDDAVAPSSPRAHTVFSQMLKQITANDFIEYRPMYRRGSTHQWLGRCIITMNDDPESLRLIPETNIAILDKFLLLKAHNAKLDYFAQYDELKKELPYFAAFLLQYNIPEHCQGSARFGVTPFHHPELLQQARISSNTGQFDEVLQLFMENLSNPWQGTSSQLFSTWVNDAAIEPFTRTEFKTPTIIGRRLSSLEKQNNPQISSKIIRGNRIWTINP